MAALAVVPVTPETVSGLSRRLAELLEQSESEGVQGQLPDATREQAAGLVEVLPQKWFTAAQYRVGQQWITRATRVEESHRILGECHGVGTFLLQEDGCRLERWLQKVDG